MNAARGVVSRIDLEAVGMISPPQTLPNVMEGESFALRELLHVPQLMQKELGIESRVACEKDRPAKRDCSDCRLPQHDATNAKRETTSPVSQLPQLRPSNHEFIRQRDAPAEQSLFHFREISQLSPPAS